MGERPGVKRTSAYEAAEERLRIPPIRRRGLENESPPELGDWRLGLKNPLRRAPCSSAYEALQKGVELVGGITLPCTTKLRRRVRRKAPPPWAVRLASVPRARRPSRGMPASSLFIERGLREA